MRSEQVNILLVDDQPAKLLSYEVVLRDLGHAIIKANSATEALAILLNTDVAIVLMDVSMPDLDGFQLAAMIREHPRFTDTAIIFVSGVHLEQVDFLRGYEMGAVDYVTVPVIPEILRAKVRVFADLYRKTRELEQFNRHLEERVRERTAEVEAAAERLRESEQRRSLALAAGQMGSWDWDVVAGDCHLDENQRRIFGVDAAFRPTPRSIRALIHREDLDRLEETLAGLPANGLSHHAEFRVRRPGGDVRWCFGSASATLGPDGRVARISGVTIDITERKEAEDLQALLAREVDHRAKNALAVVQTIVRLSRAPTIESYVEAVEGRIAALSRAHALLAQSRWQGADFMEIVEEELAPYGSDHVEVAGPKLILDPRTAQAVALAIHELGTNAAKYGAFSTAAGRVSLSWEREASELVVVWKETGGPQTGPPRSTGFGLKAIAASTERQLQGTALFDWRKEGLRCTLSLPYDERITVADREVPANGAGRSSTLEDSRPGSDGAKRVLLVEDEALVAMMMQDLLVEFGYSVIGPFASVADALPAAKAESLGSAVLDVNLGRGFVYPVAEILRSRGIPFVFVTGYGTDSIDPTFAEVEVLSKPVDQTLLRRFLEKDRSRGGNVAARIGERVARQG